MLLLQVKNYNYLDLVAGSTPSHLSSLGIGGDQGHPEENGGRRDEEIQSGFESTEEMYFH